MRLIDADNIPYTEMDVGLGDGMYDVVKVAYECDIEAQSTVDAIPVEWIEETMKLAETVGAKEYAEHLEVLLADWEEREEE